MKLKLICGVILACSVLYTCSSGASENAEAELNEQLNHEADSLEELDAKIEQTKKEIEESTKEVDELLKDL